MRFALSGSRNSQKANLLAKQKTLRRSCVDATVDQAGAGSAHPAMTKIFIDTPPSCDISGDPSHAALRRRDATAMSRRSGGGRLVFGKAAILARVASLEIFEQRLQPLDLAIACANQVLQHDHLRVDHA